LELILRQWTGGDVYNRHKLREGFIRHNQHIRDIVPPENLFEFQLEDMKGWEPLCKFLGKDVPEEPYPRINEGDSVAKFHAFMYWRQLFLLVGGWLKMPLAVGGLAWGLRWMQRRGTLEMIWKRLTG